MRAATGGSPYGITVFTGSHRGQPQGAATAGSHRGQPLRYYGIRGHYAGSHGGQPLQHRVIDLGHFFCTG